MALALAILAQTLVVTAGSEALSPHFQRIGSVSGPPAEAITALFQDSEGFVWIGSRDGLSVYDGYSFKEYRHDPGDTTSISDNSVRMVYEDRAGTLWVGTNTGGLNRLDRATGAFESFRHDSADAATLSHDSVYVVADAGQGALWVGTQRGLNLFDPRTGRSARYLADPDDDFSLSHEYVICLLVDRQKRLWVGTNEGGLNALDPATGRFRAFRHDPGDTTSISSDSVYSLFEDGGGGLWVGTSAGLASLDPETGRFQRFELDPIGMDGSISRFVGTVSLAAGAPGTLWVATLGAGLYELDMATGRNRAFRHLPAVRHSLGDNRIFTLLSDTTGSLWVGTFGGGLWRLTPSALLLASAGGSAPVPAEVANVDVTSLAADRTGGLYIGNRIGELAHKASNSTRYELLPSRPWTILSIVDDRTGTLWWGTSRGIVRLDRETDTLTALTHDPNDAQSIGKGYVRTLFEDRQGRLWAGTGEGGLQVIDDRGRVLARYVNDPDDPQSLSDDYVTAVLETGDGTLWVGTRSGGLNAFDPSTGAVTRYQPDPQDASTISHHYVTAIHEDSSGQLWIGTSGAGLNRLHRDGDGGVQFERFTTANGLIDDNVMAILEDDDGSLWFSTKRGLSRIDPGSGTVTHLFAGDGLPSAEFEPGAAARTAENLYFGSVRWIAAVPAGTPFPEHSPSPIAVTSIRIAGNEVPVLHSQGRGQHLEVPFGQLLSFELAVLDFNADQNHAYAFRLGDEDQDWVQLGSRREITFMDMDPGTYELAVRGRNSQGVWSEITPTLSIRVPPPLWMTTWFRGLLVFAVVAAVAGLHRTRMSALERRNLQLMELHNQREKARTELTHAYDRLRQLTRRLELAKEEERKRIARELHDDMGPSLTAVIINLQLATKNEDPAEAARWIAGATELVDRMVQQIRDLSLALRPPLLDEMGLVPALKGYLETQAERTGLEIAVTGTAAAGELPPEIEIAAFRLVQEAVSNVVRHANASTVEVVVDRRPALLDLAVEDDGCGFDPEATLEHAATGKALGLLGMQERAAALAGDLAIDSELGVGTCVRATLPLEGDGGCAEDS